MLTRGVQMCGIGDVFIFRVTTPSNIIVLPGLAVWVSWRTGLWIYGSIDLTTKQFISEGKERKMIPNDSVVLNDSTWSRVIPAEMSVHACIVSDSRLSKPTVKTSLRLICMQKRGQI